MDKPAPEFKSFGEIKRLGKIHLSITQKLHGTNAQIYIYDEEIPDTVNFLEDGTTVPATERKLICGSRTRWIYPGDDNFGFAGFVNQHKQAFIEKLGPGRHYGEWIGPGINSGEGLKEKTFALFNWEKEYPSGLPPQTILVPVLFDGFLEDVLDFKILISEVMESLKDEGSKLVPGFMRPEGIVIDLNGQRFKKVFAPEETQWIKPSGVKAPKGPKIDYSHLLQPIRLEKLLSRDERYVREYPKSLPEIVKDYVADLIKEEQIAGTEDEVKAIKKGASGDIFKFVKTVIEEGDL